MRIYLDNCCFNRPFDDQQQVRIRLEAEAKLHVQEKILKKEIDLVWSYILDYENDLNPFEERKSVIENWTNHAVLDVTESRTIIRTAEQLVRKKIMAKDALHLACAIAGKCDYFLTTDDNLLAKANHLKQIAVINPLEFITIIEKQ